jgi:Tfp pilus assembly protein PilF
MAKPMLVTLPFVLLLLDFWPLQRAPELPRLVKEKLPLFALAAISSVVTVLAQRHGGAVAALERLPLGIRLTNVPASYLAYIGKMLWPVRLAAFYPLHASTPVLQVTLGALLLIGVTILAIRAGRRHGYLLVGWLWYVGTLIPVIGLVQAGSQSMADRYTYVPLIGLFLIAAWGVPELVARWRYGRVALPFVAACVLLAHAALARSQVGYWSDSTALWQHALEVTEDNYVAHASLGKVLLDEGKAGEAIPHFTETLRIQPNYVEAKNNLGMALAWSGKLDEAAQQFAGALRIKPDFPEAQSNLGMVLMSQGKLDEAARRFAEALRIKPDFVQAQNNLGTVLMRQGKLDEAARCFGAAVRSRPDVPELQNNLGLVLMSQGKPDEAAQHFAEALRVKPDFADAGKNLNRAMAQRQRR